MLFRHIALLHYLRPELNISNPRLFAVTLSTFVILQVWILIQLFRTKYTLTRLRKKNKTLFYSELTFRILAVFFAFVLTYECCDKILYRIEYELAVMGFDFTLPLSWFPNDGIVYILHHIEDIPQPDKEIIITCPKHFIFTLIAYLTILIWIIAQLARTKTDLIYLKSKNKKVAYYCEIVLRVLVVIIVAYYIYDWCSGVAYRWNNNLDINFHTFNFYPEVFKL